MLILMDFLYLVFNQRQHVTMYYIAVKTFDSQPANLHKCKTKLENVHWFFLILKMGTQVSLILTGLGKDVLPSRRS
jgi:hypothetical protein